MEDTYKELTENFERLKKNRENVPLEVLKTKYKTGYENLKHKLAKGLSWYVDQIAMLGIGRIAADDFTEEMKADWQRQVKRISDEEKARGLPKELGHAIFGHLDMVEFENLVVGHLTNRIRYEIYAPYWLKHCKEQPDGKIRNDLIGMTWDPEHSIWESVTEDGHYTFTAMLPPTQELINKDREKDAADFEAFLQTRRNKDEVRNKP